MVMVTLNEPRLILDNPLEQITGKRVYEQAPCEGGV
jgi:hypothetical protein